MDPISEIISVLDAACHSKNSQQQHFAMEKIKNYETFENISLLYIQIIERNFQSNLNSVNEVNIRLLAAIALKNYILKYWNQRNLTNHNNHNNQNVIKISEENKNIIKNFVINFINEPEKKISLQISLIGSKIARFDYPEKWDNLINNLINNLNVFGNVNNNNNLNITEKDNIKFKRTLSLFYFIIKELHLIKINKISNHLLIVSSDLFLYFNPLFFNYSQLFLNDISSKYSEDLTKTQNTIEQIFIIVKILKVCLTKSFQNILINNFDINNFFIMFYDCLNQFLSIIRHHEKTISNSDLKHLNEFYYYDRYCNIKNVSRQNYNNSNETDKNDFLNNDNNDNEDDEDDDIYNYSYPQQNNSFSVSNYYDNVIIPTLQRVIRVMTNIPLNIFNFYPLEITQYLLSFLKFYRNNLFLEYNFTSIAAASSNNNNFENNENKSSITSSVSLFSYSSLSNISLKKNPSNYSLCYYGIIFISQILSSQELTHFDSLKRKDSTSIQTIINQVETIKQTFFNEETIVYLFQLLIMKLLHFSQDDLDEWNESSEDFYIKQQELESNENIKTVSETLFLNILDFSPESVCQLILTLLQNTETQFELCQTSSTLLNNSQNNYLNLNDNEREIIELKLLEKFNEALIWDSIYLGAGLAAQYLGQCFSGDALFSHVIQPILTIFLSQLSNKQLSHSHSHGKSKSKNKSNLRDKIEKLTNDIDKIILHRILWLATCWTYHFSSSTIVSLLELLFQLLQFSEVCDVACVLRGIQTIDGIVECQSFKDILQNNLNLEAVESHVNINLTAILIKLCQVISTNVEEHESKCEGVMLVSKIINCISTNELAYVFNELSEVVYSWWIQSDAFSLLKTHILQVFINCVKRAGPSSLQLHNKVLSMISFSCSNQVETNFMLREGSELWIEIMKNMPPNSYYSTLSELFNQNYVCLFEEDASESLGSYINVFSLIELYIIAGGSVFLRECAFTIVKVYNKKLCLSLPSEVQFIVRPLELLFFVISPNEVVQFLVESKLLFTLVRACYSSTNNLFLSQVLQEYQENDVSVVSYLSLLARVLIFSPQVIQSICYSLSLSILMKENNNGAIEYQDPNQIIPNNIQVDPSLDPNVIFINIIRLFVEKFDLVSYNVIGKWKKRLWCLCLLSFFPTSDINLLDLFPEIIYITSGVIQEELEENYKNDFPLIIFSMLSNEILNHDFEEEVNLEKEFATDMSLNIFKSFFEKDEITICNILNVGKQKWNLMKSTHGNQMVLQVKSICGDDLIFN